MDHYIPEFSSDAQINLDLFYSQYEEILLYIEDDNGIFLYETLLNRLFNKDFHVRSVSGKQKLKEVFHKYKEMNDETLCPSLFIADLDFEAIMGEELIAHDSFLYLERYSIESYFVDEQVGAKFLNGRNNKGIKACKKELLFRDWINAVQEQFKQLVILYPLVQILELGIANANNSYRMFTKKDTWELDNSKISLYLNTIYSECRNKKIIGFSNTYIKIKDRISGLYPNDYWRIIPGRQILGVYIDYLSTFVTNPKPVKQDFLNFAVQTCDINYFSFLQERIDLLVTDAEIVEKAV